MVRKRRVRSPHPGVKILRVKRGGREYWVARYRDPDLDDKRCQIALNVTALPTREARRVWGIRKAKALAARRSQLALGAPERTYTPIEKAIDEYLDAGGNRLRPRTLSIYTEAIKQFRTWLSANGIQNVEKLTRARLVAFREFLIARPKLSAVVGGGRGEYRASNEKRSPFSVGRDLRAVKTLVLYWHGKEIVPSISRDAICAALKSVPTAREAPAYLPPEKCRKLLEAALRHDAEAFTATREEHAGLRPLGTTPKHRSIAPFTLFLLLTGCRAGEALSLRWQDVDLEALDAEGRKVGEIRLQATATKTKHWRAIGLEVCPSLRQMLAAMKLKTGSGEYVFRGKAPLSRDTVEAARKRLGRSYGAPRFTWQNLRQTTGTFLTNAPGIYGAASVFMSARQLGHSVMVAEKHYLGVVRGIAREARTLEAAMQIEDLARQIITRVSGEKVDLQRAEVIGFPR